MSTTAIEDDTKSRRSKRVANAAAHHHTSSTIGIAGPNNNSAINNNSNLPGSSGGGSNVQHSTGATHVVTHHKAITRLPIDFAKLDMSSLLRYKRAFHLTCRPTAPKSELIGAVRKHFAHHPKLRDFDVIASFLYANQRLLEQKHKTLKQ